MMQIKVKNNTVKRNLDLLKELLRRSDDCTAWVETTTGEMYPEVPSDIKDQSTWKEVHIHVLHKQKHRPAAVVLNEDSSHSDTVFSFQDWTKEARQSVLKTIHAINSRLAAWPYEGQTEGFFKAFASAEISLLADTSNPIVHEAWLNLDREGAEEALQEKSCGTYLFRKDDAIEVLEQELNEQFGGEIHCLTLTYIDPEGKVCDKTVVHKNEVFLIYDDDPLLKERSYRTIEEVIQSLDTKLHNPLKKPHSKPKKKRE